MMDEQKGIIANDNANINFNGPVYLSFEAKLSQSLKLPPRELIEKACKKLHNRLGYLEQEYIEASGFEAADLKKKLEKCKKRLQFFIDVREGKCDLPFELPTDCSIETLLSDVWDDRPPALSISEQVNRGNPPYLAHLIIAIFWQERSKERVRVQPELCYHHPNKTEKHCISLRSQDRSQDSDLVKLSEFHKYLKKLVDFAAKKLDKRTQNSIQNWQLIINLFLPVDLLRYSLKQWCGESSPLTQQYSLVVRCSDRFNPEQSNAPYLHNQLKKGWQRFCKSATQLRQLNWIQPTLSWQGDLEQYEGVQCLGDWLKSDEQYLKCWRKLVESGIPIALWMCEAMTNQTTITQTFDSLTDCSSSEFLERVRRERRQPCVSSIPQSGYHLGVFYEDPNYVPTVLEEEEQFFSWAE
jgi:hypothetical protein